MSDNNMDDFSDGKKTGEVIEEIASLDEIVEIDELLPDEEPVINEPKSRPMPPPLPPPLPPRKTGQVKAVINKASPDVVYRRPDISRIDEFLQEVKNGFKPTDVEYFVNLSTEEKNPYARAVYLNQAGWLSEKSGNPGQALKYYASSLDADKTFIPNLRSLRRVLKIRGLREKIIPLMDLQNTTTDDPAEKAVLEYLIAVEKDALGNPAAESHYIKALEYNPSHIPSLLALARKYLISGMISSAAKIFENIAALSGDASLQCSLLMYIGHLYENDGNNESAEEFFRRALGSFGGHLDEIWFRIYNLAFKSGEPSKKLDALNSHASWLLENSMNEQAEAIIIFISWLIESQHDASMALEYIKTAISETSSDSIHGRAYDLAIACSNWDFIATSPYPYIDGYMKLLAKAHIGIADDEEYQPENLIDKKIKLLLVDRLISDSDALSELSRILEDEEERAFAQYLGAIKDYLAGRPGQQVDIAIENNIPENILFNYIRAVTENNSVLTNFILDNADKTPESIRHFFLKESVFRNISLKQSPDSVLPAIQNIIEREPDNNLFKLFKSFTAGLTQPEYSIQAYRNISDYLSGDEKLASLLTAFWMEYKSGQTPDFNSVSEFESNPEFTQAACALALVTGSTDKYKDFIKISASSGNELAILEHAFSLSSDTAAMKDAFEYSHSPLISWWKWNLLRQDPDSNEEVLHSFEDFVNSLESMQDSALIRLACETAAFDENASISHLNRALELSPDSALIYQLLYYYSCRTDSLSSISRQIPETSPVWIKLAVHCPDAVSSSIPESIAAIQAIEQGGDIYSLVAAEVLNYIYLRDNMKDERLDLVKRRNPDRAQYIDFIDNLLSGTQNTEVAPEFDAFVNPVEALSSTLTTILGPIDDDPEYQSWISLSKEIKGKAKKCIENRPMDGDYRLPSLLAFRRLFRSCDFTSIELLMKLLDELPLNCELRRKILQEITIISQDSTTLITALWKLNQEFPGDEEYLKNAFIVAMETDDLKLKAVIYNSVRYSGLPEDDYSEIEAILQEMDDPDNPENWPEILKPDYRFNCQKEIDFSAIDSFNADDMYIKLIEEDAILLSNLHYEHDKSVWLREAARLYVAMGEKGRASIIEEVEEVSPLNTFLKLSIALTNHDQDAVFTHLKTLYNRSPFISAFAGEYLLSSNMDLEFLDDSPGSKRIRGDRLAAESNLDDYIKTTSDANNPASIYATALMGLEESPEISFEKFRQLLSTDFSQGSSFHLLFAKEDDPSEGFSRYNNLYPDDFSTLLLLISGQTPAQLTTDPAVLWSAYDRELTDFSTFVSFIKDPNLKARVYAAFLFKNTGVEFDPGVVERSLMPEVTILENMRIGQMSPDDRYNFLRIRTSTSPNEYLRIWFSDPGEYNWDENVLRLFEYLRCLLTDYNFASAPDFSGIENPEILINSIACWNLLRGNDGFSHLATPAIRRYKSFTENDSNSLISSIDEELSISEHFVKELSFFKTALTRESDGAATIFNAVLSEKNGISQAWEPVITTLSSQIRSFSAIRCMVLADIQADELADSIIEYIPEDIRNEFLYRFYRRTGDMDMLHQINKTSTDLKGPELLRKVLNSSLVSESAYKILWKSSSEVCKTVYLKIAWENQHFADLTAIQLEIMDKEDSTPKMKSDAFRNMALIDEYGRNDFENAMFTRYAFAGTDSEDIFNLLLLLADKRNNSDLVGEIELMKQIISSIPVELDRNGFIAERIRLEDLAGMPLPASSEFEEIRDLIISNGEILYWWYLKTGTDFPIDIEASWYTTDPRSRNTYLYRIAYSIAESDPAKALQLCAEILNSSEIDLVHVLNLSILLTAEEKSSDAACAIIQRMINYTAPGSDARYFSYLTAGLISEHWGDNVQAASGFYSAAMDEKPSSIEAFSALRHALDKIENYNTAAGVLERRLEFVSEPAEILTLLEDLIDIYSHKINKIPFAVINIKRYLEIAPTDIEYIYKLATIYNNQNNETEETAVLEMALKCETDPEKLSETYIRLGSIFEKTDTQKAIGFYMKSLEHKQKEELFYKLYELYVSTGDYRNAVRSLKRYITGLNNPEEKIKQTVVLAEIFEKHLSDNKNALSSYTAAVEMDSSNIEAIKELVGFFNRTNDRMSRNVKLDMLWVNERNHVTGPKSGKNICNICNFLELKQEHDKAKILADVAAACGIEKSALPVAPTVSVIDFSSLEKIRSIFQHPVHDAHLRLLSFINTEARKYYKDIFKRLIPQGATRLKNVPSEISDALGDVRFSEIYSADVDCMLIPMESPILILNKKLLDKELSSEAWRFILTPLSVFYTTGPSLLYSLGSDEAKMLLCSIIKHTFPEKDFDVSDPSLFGEYLKLTGKLFSRMDRSTYAGYIIEIGEITPDIGSKILASMDKAADILGYFAIGSFKGCMEALEALGKKDRLENLIRFIVTPQHFAAREEATRTDMTFR